MNSNTQGKHNHPRACRKGVGGADQRGELPHGAIQLVGRDGTTELTIEQDNNSSEEEKAESEKNWKMMLEGLKRLLEQ